MEAPVPSISSIDCVSWKPPHPKVWICNLDLQKSKAYINIIHRALGLTALDPTQSQAG